MRAKCDKGLDDQKKIFTCWTGVGESDH